MKTLFDLGIIQGDVAVAGLTVGIIERDRGSSPIYRFIGDALVCVEYDYVRQVNDASERSLALAYIRGYQLACHGETN